MTETVDALQSLLSGLNDPQREAVTFGEGPLLILAGAGSGKTRVLTHRIAYLVATDQARPNEILAITFTNKAASEMRDRAELLVGRRVRAMWIMTFHSACARMLRAHADKLGYTRQFTIYDQADSRRLIKRCLDEQGVDPKRFTPGAIGNQISAAKNQLLDADAYGQKVGSFFEQTVADIYRSYERQLHRMNAMDFDDLLVRAVNVLELFQEVRDAYAAGFRHVLVDEYQDTNHAQYRWLQLLASEHRNLMVVGDDAQSIYGFRGADIKNILEFEDTFVDAHVVKLEQNYRSTQTILDAANALIANNRGQKPKSLWTDVGQGDPIKVRECEDEHAEARLVAGEIQRLVDEGTSRSEIAVFYRTNAQSRVLEDMLVRTEIGYQVIGGTRFYERAEIKDALAYLTVLVNPQDAGSFTRVVNSPRRGHRDHLGLATARLRQHDGRLGVGRRGGPRCGAGSRRRGGQGDPAVHGHDGDPPRARRVGRPGRRAAQGDPPGDRIPGGARGRADDRGPGPDREPGGARQRGGRVRRLRHHRRGPRPARVPPAAGAGRRRRRPRRRRGAGDAHDAPQRQGPRVSDRVHDRDGGGGVPALPGARRGRPGGGAPALLRRHHARRAGPVPHPRPDPDGVRRPQLRGPEPVHRRGAGGAHRPGGADRSPGPARDGRRPRPGAAAGTRPRPSRRHTPSGWATTSCTRPSARGWSPESSPEGSSSSASAPTAPSASSWPTSRRSASASVPHRMAATIIDGRAVAARVREQVARDVAAFAERHRRAPGLATILVGEDPASEVYVGNKRKACAEAGIADFHRHLPASASQDEVAALIEAQQRRPAGQRDPAPAPGAGGARRRGPHRADRAGQGRRRADADQRRAAGAGRRPGLRPCTPSGVIELLDAHGVTLEGAEAVVVGRSDLVGKPVAALLLGAQRDGDDLPLAHAGPRRPPVPGPTC